MSDQYIYGFVRKDLPVVQQIIQFGHAISEISFDLGGSPDCPIEPPNVCLFEVEDEDELIATMREIKGKVHFHMFHERDHDMGFTALATVPVRGEDRELFRNYKRYVS